MELSALQKQLEDCEQRNADFEIRVRETDDTDLEALTKLSEESDTLFKESNELQERKKALEQEIYEIKSQMSIAMVGMPVEKSADIRPNYTARDALKDYMECKKSYEKPTERTLQTIRDAGNAYLMGQRRKNVDPEIESVLRANGFVSNDGELLIPVDILYTPTKMPETIYSLENYVNHVSVSTSSGRRPIQKRTDARMYPVAELERSPELAKPEFHEISYQVETYRGLITISQEAIDDTQGDLISLIANHMEDIRLNTTNALLAPIFKSFPKVTAKSLDDIKKVDDLLLDEYYSRSLLMTKSMYHYLNTMKDKHGDYLLQEDITAGSGKQLLGMPITRFKDSLMGEYAGHLACFMGDSRSGITVFDRITISARWIDHPTYSQALQIGFRADFKKADENAGYYITFAPPELDYKLEMGKATTPETVEGVSAEWSVNSNIASVAFKGLEAKHTPSVRALFGKNNAVVAQSPGHLEITRNGDQVDVVFGPAGAAGKYTLEARVKDTGTGETKTVSSLPLTVAKQSDEVKADIDLSELGGVPIVIAK